MKKNILKQVLILSTITLFISCNESNKKAYTEAEIAAESEKVNAFFQKSFDDGVAMSPEFQTRLGIKKNYGKLNDNSPEFDEKELERKKKELIWLTDSVNVDALSKPVLLSYNLFKQSVTNEIEDYKFRLHNYPVNQMFGAQSTKPAFLINMHRIDSIADAEAYVSRLNGFKKYFAQLVENLKAREAIGVMPPKFVFDKVIQDSKNILVGEPFDRSQNQSTLLNDFMSKVNTLEIDNAAKRTLEDQAKAALVTSVKPAYELLISFMKAQKERANSDHGAWKFPDGEAFYNNALKRTTTTDLSADDIHNIGLAEVEICRPLFRLWTFSYGIVACLQIGGGYWYTH